MNDRTIRKSFHEKVLEKAHADKETLVLDEFSLKNGASRADIAVLNGKMVGYEIKTEADTLTRLALQIQAYNEVFDNVYLVTASKHLEKAITMIPNWWGVFLITQKIDRIHFQPVRKAKRNPNKEAAGILQLLWREEIVNFLSACQGVKLKKRQPKRELYEIARHVLSTSRLSKITLECLKSREGWRTDRKVLS